MKKLVLIVGLLLIATPIAFAAPKDVNLKSQGFDTATGVVTGSRALVRGFVLTCGGSACTASLYNANTVGEATNANGMVENNAAANSTAKLEFDTPIDFTGGVWANLDANATAVSVLYQ